MADKRASKRAAKTIKLVTQFGLVMLILSIGMNMYVILTELAFSEFIIMIPMLILFFLVNYYIMNNTILMSKEIIELREKKERKK